jgi:hypothetical protein
MKHQYSTSSFLIFLLCLLFQYVNAQKQEVNADSISWTVRCNSLNKGNERKFTGTPDDLNHFKKHFEENTKGMEQDLIVIEMTFNSTKMVLKDTLPYGKAAHFFQNHSVLLSDCESYDFAGRIGGRYGGLWLPPFFNSKNTIDSEIDEKTKPAEGKGYFYMSGTSENSPNKKFVCELTRKITPDDFVFHSEPSDTWFSLYIRGESDPNAYFRLGVSQQESVHSNNYYYTDVSLNFSGWKQIAVRYSDMQLAKPANDIPIQIQNTSYIKSIHYGLFSKDPTAKVRANLDYLMLVFTKTKKF